MNEKEQVQPLSLASHRVQENEILFREMKNYNNRKRIKCCGIFTALVLILAVIVLVLFFTVFHIKDPVLKMNSVKIEGLDVAIGANFRPGANLTLVADVSVKNPNVASFKFHNATTYVYYAGKMIGEARNPPGHVGAKGTVVMKVTMDIMVDQLVSVPRLLSDLEAGSLAMGSYTRISGKVKILNIIKKNVVVRMNCTMTLDINSQSIRDQDCKSHVSL